MHDTFRRLMEQAIVECHSGDNPSSAFAYSPRISKENTLQRYGELIVQECLDIMNDERYNRTILAINPIESGAIYDAHYNIKSHFGVK